MRRIAAFFGMVSIAGALLVLSPSVVGHATGAGDAHAYFNALKARGDHWRSYSLQMHDARGSTIGKISRKSEDINKVIFTEKSAFYVVHLYIPQPDAFRKLLLGTAAAMALLLR